MTQEDKKLLLKDLCARLPYGVKLRMSSENNGHLLASTVTLDIYHLHRYMLDGGYHYGGKFYKIPGFDLLPYLHSMSSMTKEQKKEYQYITERWMYDSSYSISDSIDWLNKNHFDYRNLIDKNLAIDATGLNIY